ncbi:MAG: SDR family NAD(P)-dependent oxidoreductase, partial [Xanthomonadales bacterium]|nr:SDR family NAD(P)-dependent oxidoreductase [Xanthomonadales bacterium]
MILDSFALHDRTALVTGANTGLGQAIAIALAQAGADIVCLGRSEPADTAAALAKLGRRCHWVQADLAGSESAETMLQAAVAAGGPLHILVNNAGTIRRNDALDFSEADWDEVMEVNLKRAFFLSQAFARHLRADQRGGKIINIASMLSYLAAETVPDYIASKTGIVGLTRALAHKYGRDGGRANAIAVG